MSSHTYLAQDLSLIICHPRSYTWAHLLDSPLPFYFYLLFPVFSLCLLHSELYPELDNLIVMESLCYSANKGSDDAHDVSTSLTSVSFELTLVHSAWKTAQLLVARDRAVTFLVPRHLTGFRHAVKLLYQHCLRDQVRVRTASEESTVHGHSWQRRLVLQMLAGIFCLARAEIRHVRAFVFMFLSVCREDGHAFRSHSPPLLDFNLTSVHLSSFDLTLAHSAWENCTTACRKGSRTHLSVSAASRSFLLISHPEPILRHRSTASSGLCLPADHRQPSIPSRFLTANLRSTFRVSTLVMDSELSGTSSGGSI